MSTFLFYLGLAAACLTVALVVRRRTHCEQTADAAARAVGAAVIGARAGWFLAHGDTVLGATAAGIAALYAWWAWDAWKRRPPRKRRPSRVAARVRDLGHRLTVVPAGAR